ncbi:hypothetical protein BJ508DRAFT_88626 [Ascobolus immersus RN42]|uniref:Uncharacterized protein n=1 Tax=Ascobolus immersus RN42 TaxID=1160509 RepID=A0A3N4ILE2_ASCIM|nr:hypothetical protein BJ508DRAFT_88626 [Ascobolus immersus RN42]
MDVSSYTFSQTNYDQLPAAAPYDSDSDSKTLSPTGSYYSKKKATAQHIEQAEPLGGDGTTEESSRKSSDAVPPRKRKVLRIFINHTQLDIIGNYLIAVVVSVFLLWVYLALDHRVVKETSRLYRGQKLLRIAEYLIINLFWFHMMQSLATSYHQILFFQFRKKSYTALQIDRLLTLLSDSFFSMFWRGFGWKRAQAKRERLFVFLVFLISAAFSVPFGALNIDPGWLIEERFLDVPSANLTRRIDESWPGINAGALFQSNLSTLDYLNPRRETRLLATAVLVNGHPLFGKNPQFPASLGPMDAYIASYPVEYQGPRYHCRESDVQKDFKKENALLSEDTQYLMAGNGRAFTMWFQRVYRDPFANADPNGSDNPHEKSKFVSISCKLGVTDYRFDMEYNWGTPKLKYPRISHHDYSFEEVTLTDKNATFGRYYAKPDSRLSYDRREIGASSGQQLWQRYLHLQALALSTALVDTLRGSIEGFGTASEKVEGTQILTMTRFAQLYAGRDDLLYLQLTPASIEKALEDIAISLLHLNSWTARVPVAIERDVEVFIFDRNLFAYPIVAILGLSLFLNLIGLYCLYRNGVPASDRFLSIVGVTAASEGLREVALENSHGGGCHDGDFTDDLRDIVVKFGRAVSTPGLDDNLKSVTAYTSSVEFSRTRNWTACFGTDEEVNPYPMRRSRRGSRMPL